MSKNLAGRPPFEDRAAVKDTVVTFNVTPAQRAELAAAALSAGVSVSEVVRRRVFLTR